MPSTQRITHTTHTRNDHEVTTLPPTIIRPCYLDPHATCLVGRLTTFNCSFSFPLITTPFPHPSARIKIFTCSTMIAVDPFDFIFTVYHGDDYSLSYTRVWLLVKYIVNLKFILTITHIRVQNDQYYDQRRKIQNHHWYLQHAFLSSSATFPKWSHFGIIRFGHIW